MAKKNLINATLNGGSTKPQLKNYQEQANSATSVGNTGKTPSTTEKTNIEQIVGEYVNSANTNKSSLAGSMLDQYKNIQDNTVNAKNEAYKAQQNAMKYSENVLKANGLGNTGVAETTGQNINNNYMNAINNANANKATQEQSLLENYRNSLNDIKNEASSKAVINAENLLPYYMDDEAKLNEYMANIEANEDISAEDKQYIRDYLSALENQKIDVLGQDLENNRNQFLEELAPIINSGEIPYEYKGFTINKVLSDEEYSKLETLYRKIEQAKTGKEMSKYQQEVNEEISKIKNRNH